MSTYVYRHPYLEDPETVKAGAFMAANYALDPAPIPEFGALRFKVSMLLAFPKAYLDPARPWWYAIGEFRAAFLTTEGEGTIALATRPFLGLASSTRDFPGGPPALTADGAADWWSGDPTTAADTWSGLSIVDGGDVWVLSAQWPGPNSEWPSDGPWAFTGSGHGGLARWADDPTVQPWPVEYLPNLGEPGAGIDFPFGEWPAGEGNIMWTGPLWDQQPETQPGWDGQAYVPSVSFRDYVMPPGVTRVTARLTTAAPPVPVVTDLPEFFPDLNVTYTGPSAMSAVVRRRRRALAMRGRR